MKHKFVIIVLVLAAAAFGAALFILERQPATMPTKTATRKIPEFDLAALTAKAESGDLAAQTSLGHIYLQGSAVKASFKEAAKWFRLAAEKNYPDALAALGELTQAGQGVPLNMDEAVRLYQRAAEGGSVAGQYDLAYLYEQGNGVKPDEHEAAKWCQLAAEGGDPVAQYDIGQRCRLGVGVATNRVQAYKWLALAAAQGQADSAKLLPEVQREMSGAELTEARQLAEKFTPRGSK